MERMKGKRGVCTHLLTVGLFIHSLNQPVVSSLQPSTPVLQAMEMAFTWLYLDRDTRVRGVFEKGPTADLTSGDLGTPGLRANRKRVSPYVRFL